MRLNNHKNGVRRPAPGLRILRSGRRKPEAGSRFYSYAD